MKWRWIFIVAFVLLLASLIGWRLTQKRAAAAEEAQSAKQRMNAPASVQTVPVTRRDVREKFTAVGSVEPITAVDITPRISARILSLNLREGDAVQAGQVVATLDPNELEAQVRQRQADVAQAESRLAEAQITQGANAATVTSEVSRQQAALSAAQAQLRQARADYDARIAAAQAEVTEAQGRVAATEAEISRAAAAITAAQANLKNAQAAAGRQESLVAKGYISQQAADDARTRAEVQEGAVGQAREQRGVAVANRDAARAQQKSAERQVTVVRNQARASIESATAAVAQARAALAAAQAGRSRTPAYQQSLSALRSGVEAAREELKAARERLSETTLRSPMNGIVTARHLDPGALASPGQPVLSIQDIRSVWVALSAPEEITRNLYQGQTATITFDALPGKTYTGRIARILPAADPQSRQFTVRVRLENAARTIRPGMFGRVSFVTQEARGALAVPREAIQREGEGEDAKTTVTVVGEDNKAQARPVTTGLSDDKYVSITSGVEAGEKVVVLTTRRVRDGQEVRTGGGRRGGPGGGGGQGAGPGGPGAGGGQGGTGGAPGSSGAPQGGAAGGAGGGQSTERQTR